MKKNLHKRKNESEYEPVVHHLDIGSLWEAVRDTDEQRDKDQHAGEVDGDHSFKKEVFEVVCSMSNDVQQHSWHIHSQDCSEQPSAQSYRYFHSPLAFTMAGVYAVRHDIVRAARVGEVTREQVNTLCSVSIYHKVQCARLNTSCHSHRGSLSHRYVLFGFHFQSLCIPTRPRWSPS